jgi:CcmD family protein
MIYLYIAYAAAVVLIGGYVLYLIAQVRSVRSELEELERRFRTR